MNISFTSKQETYIAAQVSSGDYQNASEVVRDALRLHATYRQKLLDDLRADIDRAWGGPVSTRSLQDIVAAKGQRG